MSFKEALNIFGSIKILHLDDDELQLSILKNNLECINNNIIVDSENNIYKAIQKIKKNNYDCIILGYLTSPYNDIEITSKIRQISNIPIILYTIDEIENFDDKLYKLNINDYVKKDIKINNYLILENKILNLVNNYRSLMIYEKIIKSITDLIIIIDKNNNIIFHSEGFKKYLNEENIIGESVLNIITTEDKEDFYDFLISEEKNNIDGIVIFLKDFKLYVNLYKSTIIKNDSYLILTIKDVSTQNLISEDKKALGTTADLSDNRFVAISNMSPDGIVTLSKFGYITYVNPAFCKLTGYEAKDIIGKHVFSVPTLEVRQIVPQLTKIKDFFSGKLDKKSVEFPWTRKDGSAGIGEAFINTIKVNGKTEIITILKDITNRKKKEEEYQNIFKTSPDGIIHLDIDGIIKNINDSCQNLLKINPEKYIGKSVFDLEKEFDVLKIDFLKIYKRLMSNKKIDQMEIELNNNDDYKCLSLSFGFIMVFEEKLGIQIIFRDISKQKIEQLQKKLYTDQLEKMVEERTNQIMDNEKMVTLAKVSSMIAHDLKGPLQIISNSLHLIKLNPDEQDKYMDYISKAIKQSNELIEEMRVYSKETPLKIDLVNLENIIEDSLLQIKVTENINFDSKIKINKKIGLDKSKMTRVFNNLLKNAIEAMPNGGKISIIAEEKKENVSIKIIDTGKGIQKEKIDTLFRPFQTTKAKGIGLGLNFCKNTVEAHGGSITVESEVGKGTTFTILLPIDKFNYEISPDENLIKIKDTFTV